MQANGGVCATVQFDILSEFAAANAIIDSLYNHLKVVVQGGSSGEYDAVDDAIRRWRWQWTPLVNLQHHSPITEVDNALDHVAQRRRHLRNHHNLHGKREFNRPDESGFKEEQKGESTRMDKIAEKEQKNRDEATSVGDKDLKPTQDVEENEVDACIDQNLKTNLTLMAKTFVATQMFNGLMVNVIQGLKLYEELIDRIEVSKLVSLVNDLRAAGKAGKLVGETYVVFKRPMRGHGREVIQLGVPMIDESTAAVAHVKGPKVEPIPSQLQDVINQLIDLQILTTSKPDACIIDIYNEGEYSQPHRYLPWYGRPICVMFLSECDMTFGTIVSSDRSGKYKGSIKLSFAPGSLILMEGLSADFAYCAINATKKRRILVTFTKSHPRRSILSPWGPQPSRAMHHVQSLAESTVRTHVPTYHPSLVLLDSLPLPPLAYATLRAGSVGWHEPTHPIAGTGVFIPSGSKSTHTNMAPRENGNSTTKFHDDKSKNPSNDDEQQ